MAEANRHVEFLYNKTVKEFSNIHLGFCDVGIDVDYDEDDEGMKMFSYEYLGIFHEVHICAMELKEHFEEPIEGGENG